MSCEERRDLMMLYLIDVLEPDQARALRAHLSTGCPRCIAALAEARATLQHLPLVVDPVNPPTGARLRILSRTAAPRSDDEPADDDASAARDGLPDREAGAARTRTGKPERLVGALGAGRLPPRRRAHRWRPIAAGAVSACVAFAATYAVMHRSLVQSQNQITQLTEGISELEERALDVEALAEHLRAARSRFDDFVGFIRSASLDVILLEGEEAHPDAWARLLWDREQNVCKVVTESLLPAEEGRTYRLWFVTEDDRPIRGGDFTVDETGVAHFPVSLPDDVKRLTSAAISYDPIDATEGPYDRILLGHIR